MTKLLVPTGEIIKNPGLLIKIQLEGLRPKIKEIKGVAMQGIEGYYEFEMPDEEIEIYRQFLPEKRCRVV